MRNQVKLREKGGIDMSFKKEKQAEERSRNSQCQIEIASELLTETDNNRSFSAPCIRFAIPIVVYYQ